MFLLTNARVWTGSLRRPWASAVAVDGERIVAVGSGAEVMKLGGPRARVIDLRGAMVVPGFIDAHVHLVPSALRLTSVKLRAVRSRKELGRELAAFASTMPAGSWITGGDWDHYRWGGELPTREWIDAATPSHPVFVSRHDGHMALANSLALSLAGVSAGTTEPAGGVIARDAAGEPTGLLKEEAMRLVQSSIPPPSEADTSAAIGRACTHLAERGVTSVHHMGTWDDVRALRSARAAGALRTRTYAAVPMESWELLRDEIAALGAGDDWLRLGGLKAFMDGSLGSHTAAFLAPYSDAPDDSGVFIADPEALRAQIRGARRSGLQPIIHAIGDRAVRTVLDLFEATGGDDADALPLRIEHAQHVHPADLSRFARLGVIASMQPYHLADDGRWAKAVIGAEREAQAFPIASLSRAGATVAFGSDWFVAPPEPLLAIRAAVTRQTLDGAHADGWTPTERIGVGDALRAHTIHGALAEGGNAVNKGVLERGRLADLVVLDRDLTSVPAGEVAAARILLTMIGGQIVFEGAAAVEEGFGRRPRARNQEDI